MSNIKEYVSDFFDQLKISDDTREGHAYKAYIYTAIQVFLDDGTKDKAYQLYFAFFDIYRIKTGESRTFLDLLDVLKKYEENAGILSDKQRDHYVHSVNVFALGLSIYSQNKNYRHVFETELFEKDEKKCRYDTANEEFFFRWGIASLFHDIGYPIEIINNQIKKFISFVASQPGQQGNVKPYISFSHFDDFNKIDCDITGVSKYGVLVDEDPILLQVNFNKPTDLLAYHFHKSFGVQYELIRKAFDNYLNTMQQNGFVDHGFYGALIILKWYGELMYKQEDGVYGFIHQILDSASAIMIHNSYEHMLMNPPFSLSSMNPEQHPIGYLLLLTDEIQEWNRKTYGLISSIQVDDSELYIDNSSMRVHFIMSQNDNNQDLVSRKKDKIEMILNAQSLFDSGIEFSVTTSPDLYIKQLMNQDIDTIPRPLIDNLELLAKNIHQNYNQMQLLRNTGSQLEYPTWDSLPDYLKYSNIRQARYISDKLNLIGCYFDNLTYSKSPVTTFSNEEIEIMSIYEHDLWIADRLRSGWKRGTNKDTKNKITPYLVPYEKLSEEIKDLDRDTNINIIPLLESIHMKVYRG